MGSTQIGRGAWCRVLGARCWVLAWCLAPAFVTAAALFAAMTAVATLTTLDLTKVGTFAIMGVIGLILAMLVNIFVRSSGLDLLISVLGVIIFTALTASDTQKIQRWASDPRFASGGDAVGGGCAWHGGVQ